MGIAFFVSEAFFYLKHLKFTSLEMFLSLFRLPSVKTTMHVINKLKPTHCVYTSHLYGTYAPTVRNIMIENNI